MAAVLIDFWIELLWIELLWSNCLLVWTVSGRVERNPDQ
jgi:hypothetical protein